MSVALDDRDAVPASEDMPTALVALIEGLCVETVEPLHSAAERFRREPNDQVIVVRHEAVGEASPAVPMTTRSEECNEPCAVVVIDVDRISGITARCDVVVA